MKDSKFKPGDIIHYFDYNENQESISVIHTVDKSRIDNPIYGIIYRVWNIKGNVYIAISHCALINSCTYLGHMDLDWAKLLYG